jgi:hypothetical protein
MKKVIKWIAIILGILAVVAFFCFLWFIPPFTLVPPEEFSKPVAAAGPDVNAITDPRERALAERGQYLVRIHDCSGCHTPLGDQGPKWEEFLAGGNKSVFSKYGTIVSRNLTPEKETGLARRSDEDVRRILRSGMLTEGRVAHYQDMPWAAYSNFTEEERYAILVYLRHLAPVYHRIPEDNAETTRDDPAAIGTFYGKEVAGHAPDAR